VKGVVWDTIVSHGRVEVYFQICQCGFPSSSSQCSADDTLALSLLSALLNQRKSAKPNKSHLAFL